MFNSVAGKYKSEEAATKVMDSISSLPLTITDIQNKKGREAPPRLFDLTSLQVECNKRWGWTADETLKLIQSLYEKKVTTYPRVDTTYLPDDIYPKVPNILRHMTPYAAITAPVLSAGRLPKSKKVFDSSKVTDHHAIIPTGELPDRLEGNEKLMYHLIARRFIAAFYPDCLFSTTTVNASVGEVLFKTSGKTITEPGWRTIYSGDKQSVQNKDEDELLPDFRIGETGSHKPELTKKATQPPKYYTEGTLLRAMESAGKSIDDEELREAMKENGIGRPSTRAAILETLFKRRYLTRDRKSIKATKAGIDLITLIHIELLKSARLTGIWENKLRGIEKGVYKSAEFIFELKQMVNEIVINVLSDNGGHKIVTNQDSASKGNTQPESDKPAADKPRRKRLTRLDQIECPLCHSGHIIKGRTAYGCSRYKEGCNLLLPFSEYASELTPSKLNKLITKTYATAK